MEPPGDDSQPKMSELHGEPTLTVPRSPELDQQIQAHLKTLKPITTQLDVKVWAWDKDVGHRLFNFHDGYDVQDQAKPLVGSCKSHIIFLTPRRCCLQIQLKHRHLAEGSHDALRSNQS